MKITQLNFNWYASAENGEEFTAVFIGQTRLPNTEMKCLEIIEHLPQGEGDRLYYDVIWSDGSKERIFNPNQVYYK